MVFCLPVLQGIALNASAVCFLHEVNQLRLGVVEKEPEDSLAAKLHIHRLHIDKRSCKYNSCLLPKIRPPHIEDL